MGQKMAQLEKFKDHGVVEVLTEATSNYQKDLALERLKTWHNDQKVDELLLAQDEKTGYRHYDISALSSSKKSQS